MVSRRLFLIGDDPRIRRLLPSAERAGPWEVYSFRDAAQVLASLGRDRPDLLMVRLPGGAAEPLHQLIARVAGHLPVLVIAGEHAPDLPPGVAWLPETTSKEQVDATVLRLLKPERDSLAGIVGRSAPMQEVYRLIERVAPTGATVLITGESGTGKELVARALHRLSARRDGPFVAVSCAALPHDLLESELFGHEKGAFTGAHWQKPGRFELADGGTLFLDEIGEITPATQLKLLRVLQEREFERVGGVQTLRVDVRLIAATNQRLERAVRAGTFRLDLYYRLRVVQIELPALRERPEDIPLLVAHLLARFAPIAGKPVRGATDAAMALLTRYRWPGNVRELENVIQRALVLAESDAEWITPELLPEEVRTGRSDLFDPPATPAGEDR